MERIGALEQERNHIYILALLLLSRVTLSNLPDLSVI